MIPDSIMMAFASSLFIMASIPVLVYFFDRENVGMVALLEIAIMGVLWFSFPFLITFFGG